MRIQSPKKTNLEPIDAVVTWVDGSDPAHQAKRTAAMSALRMKAPGQLPAATEGNRFSDNGELRWCLYSIRKFAPWIRHIYLVTDDQVPDFLTSERQTQLGLRVVDHTEIFRGYEWALPTFNPYAIETVLWRINDLSEHFIFFNDDFILLRSVAPADFFGQDSVVLRGEWQPVRGSSRLHKLMHRMINFILRQCFGISRTMQLHAQMNAADHAGFRQLYLRSPHVPHPLCKNVLSQYFAQNPERLKSNLAFPFRHLNNFVPVSLANHLEIKNDTAQIEKYSDIGMFSGEYASSGLVRQLLSYLESKERFLCLQSFEHFDVKDRELIESRLTRILSSISSSVRNDEDAR